ncbi:anti-sigma-K factor rskA [Arthrobacter sp. AG258]|uniref:anti-sigma factor n=1 Tax=Arthrobacter sp. AG258 TaxID=2183899 RepID=UPI00105E14B1|nr:anti-sigma factor [Arthrobacter sp. AG258]TDT85924.1 anti-sigma-K factor rskA [Arthrobacter sp. AG258]
MEHLDAELLGLMALGETPGTEADAHHLDTCPECAATLRGFRRVTDIATLDTAGIVLEQPSAGTWTAIHQALGLSPTLAADPLAGPDPMATPGSQADQPAASPAEVETPSTPDGGKVAAPIPLRPGARDRRRPRLWMATAAAGVVLGTAAGWTAAVVLGQGGTPSPGPARSGPVARVLAETPLTPLAAHTGSGEAQMEQLPDGTRQLTVHLSAEQTSGYREVWVATSDLSGMVSLGVLANDTGSFTIPTGIDLAQYPVVDISNQAYNGNPAHSDDSVARGKLSPKA